MLAWKNPLFVRLTRRDRSPSPGASVALCLLVGAAGLAAALAMLFPMTRQTMRALDRAVLALCGFAVLLTPPLIAALTAVMVGERVQAGTYRLLKVTTMPRRALMRALVGAALYRARIPIAVGFGLTPALVVGMIHRTSVLVVRATRVTRFYTMMYNVPTPPLQNVQYRAVMIGWTPEFAGWAVGTWGMALLGAALGAGLALRWPAGVAAGVAAGAILLINASGLIAIPLFPLEILPDAARAALILALAVGPYAAGLACVRYFRRWV
jgi:hypothetical protein